MSFTKTISTVAALTTIFGASVAAWKVVDYQQTPQNPQETQEPSELEKKITELERKLEETKKKQEQIKFPVVAAPITPTAPLPPVLPPVPEKNETTPR